MIAYLTSHLGGSVKKDGIRTPTRLREDNGLLASLQKHWVPDSNILILCAYPEDTERNDSIQNAFAAAFPMSGLSVRRIHSCDQRDEVCANHLSDYDAIILGGGHVPTQNAFFHKLHLRERIRRFDGILIGISAGTMNCAETVYAQPELEGESIDKNYQRFLPGLGITEYMILPHYQNIKNDILDGKRLFEDITYPDSFGQKFYALPDGSYFVIENGHTTLFGEAYQIQDGEVKQLCQNGESMPL